MTKTKSEHISASMVKNAVRMIEAVCHEHSDKLVQMAAISATHSIFGFLSIQNLQLPSHQITEILPEISIEELASYLLDVYVDPALKLATKLEHEAALEVNYAEDGSEPGTGEEEAEDSDFPVSLVFNRLIV